MGIKVTTNIDIRRLPKDLEKEFKTQMKESVIKKEIVDNNIKRGVSPVKGQGGFQRYSASYLDAIGKGRHKQHSKNKSPVNLKLSGELLDSFFAVADKLTLTIGFKHDLANVHNKKGAGEKKVKRRMLPTNSGEEFNASISNFFDRIIRSIVKRALQGQNK